MAGLVPALLRPHNGEDVRVGSHQLDAVIGSMSMIPIELTVFGIVSFCGV